MIVGITVMEGLIWKKRDDNYVVIHIQLKLKEDCS